MSKFQFRLATLVKLREAARDERRAALAEAQRALDLLDQRLAGNRQEQVELKQLCKSVTTPGQVNVDRLLDAQRYEAVLLAEAQRLTQQQATIAAECERRREALVAADREVKTLEKLRDKQLARWQQAADRTEQKQFDEIASRRAAVEAVS